MEISFQLKGDAVYVWSDDLLVATISAHEEGVRLSSKYFDGVSYDSSYPPGVVIKLSGKEVVE